MRFVVVATRSTAFTAEQFAPLMPDEEKRARQLYADGVLRDIHSRSDGNGAILTFEAADEAAVEAALDSLPLVREGMLGYVIYGTLPYRGFCNDLQSANVMATAPVLQPASKEA